MGQIKKFIVEDIRCFMGRHEIEIRPITFFVGENSTGKTTILGCIQAIVDYMNDSSHSGIHFNSNTHKMGSFEDIINKKAVSKGKFAIGLEIDEFAGKGNSMNSKLFFSLTREKKRDEPTVEKMNLILDKISGTEIEACVVDMNLQMNDTLEKAISVEYDESKDKYFINFDHRFYDENIYSSFFSYFGRYKILNSFLEQKNSDKPDTIKEKLSKYVSDRLYLSSREVYVKSFKPIRSSPERIYDLLKEIGSLGERNTPIILRNLYYYSPEDWKEIKSYLIDFAEESGLFTDVAITNLTESQNGPFQLQFRIRGELHNFADVGYGISQILPILEGITNKSQPQKLNRNVHFLMQQPEVHLHPRAQATFASFLINMLDKSNKQFIIETHSDYMVDRARIEIRKRNISHNDVSLVYFEGCNDGVKVHNICFDEMGNMINVPDSYRSFFIREAHSLFGFDS